MNDIASINNYKFNEEDHIITINENELGYTIYKIPKEDHTLGNLIKEELLDRKEVIFAGYKMTHPLEHTLLLKVKTNDNTTPNKEIIKSINKIETDIDNIREKLNAKFIKYN